MIRLFLKDLPYTLAQPMVREFEYKCRELTRWREHSKSNRLKPYLNQREVIEYLFATGIYYRYVIAPLVSTERFFDRLSSDFNAGLVVGGRELGANFLQSIQNAHKHFSRVVSDFGLGEAFFAQTDVHQIVLYLVELEERRSNEQD